MCFELDRAADPRRSGASPRRTGTHSRGRRTERASGASRRFPDERPRAGSSSFPTPRALPVLRGARAPFAERGYAAIAFDYFGRSAGAEKRDDDFEYMAHVRRRRGRGSSRRRGCRRWLRSRRAPVFTVGFCMGGRHRGSRRPGGTGSRAPSGSTAVPSRDRTGRPGRPSAPARWNARSWRCRRATTRTSRPRTTSRSTWRSRRRASSTRWSRTTARRTASSTGARRIRGRIRRGVVAGPRIRRPTRDVVAEQGSRRSVTNVTGGAKRPAPLQRLRA